MHVAHVLAGRPVTTVIDHEGVELLVLDGMLEGAFLIPLDLPHFEGVRLTHDDKDLYLARFGCKRQGKGRNQAERENACD